MERTKVLEADDFNNFRNKRKVMGRTENLVIRLITY